jgi:3-hydroxybutyryl-CoA dehydrogenase
MSLRRPRFLPALSFPERFATLAILSDLVEAGKLGTKTGAGFLNVPGDRIPELIA